MFTERQSRTDEPGQPQETSEIARWVLGISGGTILIISSVVLVGAWRSGVFPNASRMVFNALLPLLGTWVGTVLAYYFSRKNFEAASQSVERMVTLTTEQRLARSSLRRRCSGLPKSRHIRYQPARGRAIFS